MARLFPLFACLLLLTVAGCSSDKTAEQTPIKAEDYPIRLGTTASADEVDISFAVSGQGPNVVMVHCWGGNQTFFDKSVQYLAGDHTVVTLDLAGHGESGDERYDYTMNAFALDVLAVMDAAEIQQTVLVGHSMGGMICMEVARLAPDRVKGIVGVDNLQAVVHGFAREDVMRITVPMRIKYVRTVSDQTKMMFPAGTDTNTINLAKNSMTAMNPEIAISAFENLFAYDLPVAADALQVPLHLVNNSLQPINKDEWAAHGVELRITIMENVGHFPMFTKPIAFNRNLKAAIDGME